MTYEIIIDNIKIEVVKNKRQKNIYLKVKPPYGKVVVSCPYSFTDGDIKRFVSFKKDWLKRALSSFAYKKEIEYKDNDKVYLWGERLTLKLIEAKSFDVKKLNDKLFMKAPLSSTSDQRKKALYEFYRKELKKALAKASKRCENITGKAPYEYRLRIMKTRWGSCNITKKRIWLNVNLSKYPPICLDYVLVHELVHLIEVNHTPRFHSLVRKFFPDYKKAQAYLKRFY